MCTVTTVRTKYCRKLSDLPPLAESTERPVHKHSVWGPPANQPNCLSAQTFSSTNQLSASFWLWIKQFSLKTPTPPRMRQIRRGRTFNFGVKEQSELFLMNVNRAQIQYSYLFSFRVTACSSQRAWEWVCCGYVHCYCTLVLKETLACRSIYMQCVVYKCAHEITALMN